MPTPHAIQQDALDALANAAFGGLGCEDFGIVVLQGARSWNAHQRGGIQLPHGDATLDLRIAYDEREAPFVCDETGHELPGLLLSLADEGDFLACAWARVPHGSPIVGVGVDLASTYDFGDHPASDRFVRLLFTPREHELAPQVVTDDVPLAYATEFGAKEAAFKSLAHPLRTWYRTQQEELAFEVRHFAMDSTRTVRGDARNAAAQAAMERMGISRIEVNHAEVRGMALVVAKALRAPAEDDGGPR